MNNGSLVARAEWKAVLAYRAELIARAEARRVPEVRCARRDVSADEVAAFEQARRAVLAKRGIVLP